MSADVAEAEAARLDVTEGLYLLERRTQGVAPVDVRRVSASLEEPAEILQVPGRVGGEDVRRNHVGPERVVGSVEQQVLDTIEESGSSLLHRSDPPPARFGDRGEDIVPHD